MNRVNYIKQVKNRIDNIDEGELFVTSDFLDIADNKSIHMTFKRLEQIGYIKKAYRGIYIKPSYSNILQKEIEASPDQIAKAIARSNGWNIVPSENEAMNLMGVSTQVPSKIEFISDGPYREYKYKGFTLTFKHTNKNNEISNISYKSALVIRAIKGIGKGNISKSDIQAITKRLSLQEMNNLINETKYSTSWVYETVKQIYKKGQCVQQQ